MRTGWLYFDGEKRNSNDTSLTLEFTSLSPCQLVRVAGESEVVKKQWDKLGDYRFAFIILLLYLLKSLSPQTIYRKLIENSNRLEVGEWSSGRPVYKKVDGEEERFLLVNEGYSGWEISPGSTSATSSWIGTYLIFVTKATRILV